MAKRIRIGIVFKNSTGWIAGSYYLLNIINACKTLPKKVQPIFVIFYHKKNDLEIIRQTGYSFVKFKDINRINKKRTYIEAIINKLIRLYTKYDTINVEPTDNLVDVLYPADFDIRFNAITRRLFWMYDFQHIHLPQYFSSTEIISRNSFIEMIIENNYPIVFSSQNALNDYRLNWKNAKNKTFVLPFSVTLPDISKISSQSIFDKYNIKSPYFICPNQLWQHKNHKIIIDALRILKEENITLNFVFTGSLEDYRNPEFPSKILREAADFNNILFLGFIDRIDQLILLNNALAIVQPSLFEGWNTSIEDAKFLGKFTIASNIEVHMEQCKGNVIFFDPHDAFELSQILKNFNLETQNLKIIDYNKVVKSFAQNFISIIHDVIKS